jgi:Tat protein translocase TatC
MLAPLATHIAAIKRRFLIIGVTITASCVMTFLYAGPLIEWFKRPFSDELIFYGPTEALFAAIKISFLAGVVLSLPVILYQSWKFIEPALLPREQRWAVPLFCLAAAFFALGLVFCNLVILPLVIKFFVSFGMERDLTPQLSVGTFVDFNVKFMLVFGFAFEVPLVLTLLSRIGVISPDVLARYRKHAVLAALIVSAIVTPDATLFTMLLMAVPLMVLYELGILGARLFGRRTTGQPPEASTPGALPVGTAGQRIRSVALCLLPVAFPTSLALAGDLPQLKTPAPHGQEVVPMFAPSIQAIAVGKDQTVYAGSFGAGLFRSSDRGATWESAQHGLKDSFILCLTVAPDGTVYAGTFRAGIFRSRDRGHTWEALNAGLKRLEVKSLLLANSQVYAGTGDGVYVLSEKTASWSSVTKGLEDTLVHTLVIGADRTLYAGTSGKGVFRYKTGNADSKWTRLREGLVDHEGLIENFIRVLAMDKEQSLYAGTFDGGLYRSQDKGATWKPISRALPNDSIRAVVVSDRGLFVGTGRGIFKTVDQGRQWMPVNKGLTELSIQSLVDSGDGTLYAGTNFGAFRSDDDGKSWVGISAGLTPPGK